MKRYICYIVLLFLVSLACLAKGREVKLKWLHTSDLHASLFAYDYMRGRPTNSGLSAIYAYADSLRQQWGDALILTEGGDIIQGQPLAYYYNNIDTVQQHLVAAALNKMGYVAGAIGNHDIEAGHAVYDRWISQLNFPMLGANVIDTRTGQPYLPPYTVIKRQGVKIAILGLITPGVPNWLPETLWSGLRFDDMLQSARHWVRIIEEREKPDLLIGLFHSGFNSGPDTPTHRENATELVAREVKEFDAIFYGHDHQPQTQIVERADGSLCPTLGPTNAGRKVVELDITLEMKRGRIEVARFTPHIVDIMQGNSLKAKEFEQEFALQRAVVEAWIEKPIGQFTRTIREREAFFGSNAFVDLIHRMQLDLTGADISFAAPLSFDSKIDSGYVTVRDMFALYKFENFLYTMRMTGSEIKDYLEYSYGKWANQMTSPDDHLLQFQDRKGNQRRMGLKQLYYNMDSAAGIDYTVDVTKPEGQRITITGLSDGRPFDLDADYKVAVNSYRGNGGGSLMTEGAGIPHAELTSRLLTSTDKDLRYYLMQRIIREKVVTPKALDNWRFVPEAWTKPAAQRDRKLLFGE